MRQPRDEVCNARLPFGQLDARLAGLRFRAVHRGPRRDQLLAKPFEPLSKAPCGEAVILVVALDDQLVLLINALDISKLQTGLHLRHHRADILQRRRSCECIERFKLLDRVALDAGSDAVADNGVQIDEDPGPQHLIEFVLAGRVTAHEPLQRSRFIGCEMINVQVGMFRLSRA